MLAIRLSRIGKKNKPFYRLVISEKGRDLYGRALEILGSYNPHNKELKVKSERIKHWLEKGAEMSPTVNNILVGKGIIKGKKVKASGSGKKKESPKKEEAANNVAPAKAAEEKKEAESAQPAQEA